MDSRERGNDPSIWPMYHRPTQGIANKRFANRPYKGHAAACPYRNTPGIPTRRDATAGFRDKSGMTTSRQDGQSLGTSFWPHKGTF